MQETPAAQVNYDIINAFLNDPSNPKKQFAFLNELQKAVDQAIRSGKITDETDANQIAIFIRGLLVEVVEVVKLPEPRIGNMGRFDFNSNITVSRDKLAAAKPYISALIVALQDARSPEQDSHVDSSILNMALGLTAVVNDTSLSLPGNPPVASKTPKIEKTVIDTFVIDVTKTTSTIEPTRYKDVLKEAKLKIKLSLLDKRELANFRTFITKIEDLHSQNPDDPVLTDKCTRALNTIINLINDPNLTSKRRIKMFNATFYTIFNNLEIPQKVLDFNKFITQINNLQSKHPNDQELIVKCSRALLAIGDLAGDPSLISPERGMEIYRDIHAISYDLIGATNIGLQARKDLTDYVISLENLQKNAPGQAVGCAILMIDALGKSTNNNSLLANIHRVFTTLYSNQAPKLEQLYNVVSASCSKVPERIFAGANLLIQGLRIVISSGKGNNKELADLIMKSHALSQPGTASQLHKFHKPDKPTIQPTPPIEPEKVDAEEPHHASVVPPAFG